MRSFRISSRPDKSEVYSPTVSESALRAAGLPAEFVSSKIHSDGMRILGVPVGTTEYKARFCHQVLTGLAADLATLRRVPSLQAQHVILTKSLMHRVTNLLRAIPGNSLAFKDAAELCDSELRKFAQSTSRGYRYRSTVASLPSCPSATVALAFVAGETMPTLPSLPVMSRCPESYRRITHCWRRASPS